MCVKATPSQRVSSFDQRVTQWMSSVCSATGRLRNSAQRRVNGSATSPQTRKSQPERSPGRPARARSGGPGTSRSAPGPAGRGRRARAGRCAAATGRPWTRSLRRPQEAGSVDWTDAPALDPLRRAGRAAAAVGATRSKIAKRDLLAAYLRGLPPGDLAAAAVFFAGRPLIDPTAKLGLGWVQQGARWPRQRADEAALRAAYLRHSDFGDAAAELSSRAADGSRA